MNINDEHSKVEVCAMCFLLEENIWTFLCHGMFRKVFWYPLWINVGVTYNYFGICNVTILLAMVETLRTVKGYDGVITAIALVSVRPSAPPPFTPTQPRVATRLNTGPWLPWPLALLLSGSRNILESLELHHGKRLKALSHLRHY